MTNPQDQDRSLTCLHAPCDCATQGEGAYCSDLCRTEHMAGTASGPCPCGHPGCSGSRSR